jgi:hypothetical protein
MFQQILDTLNQVPADVWGYVIQIIVSAVIVSPVALALKKWWKINGEIVMMGIVILGSVLSAVLIYLQSDPRFAPWIVAVQGGLTFATTQPVYYLAVKPLYRQLSAWFTSQVAEAVELNEVKSAAVPATGLPIGEQAKQ